ncbi:hypothetical protein BB559_000428 [Furculomyces boomerangus]|uniref:Uncharacterized protein n=1 Tax=Furculomyces boomerangus TaxID=61424 RepID=A0A2T9Z595_9FUNG|nr:hypothetical protein BB559_000428 [Furculomyces boomerangus]
MTSRNHKRFSGAEFVVNWLSPMMLVVSSEKADEIAKSNGLENFGNLLAPFGQDLPVNARIIDGDGSGYYLEKLTIKFESECGDKRELKPNKKMLSEWINKHPIQKEKSLSMDTPINSTPWYEEFKQNWASSIRETPHESFGHPIITIFVASLEEDDPYKSFGDLLTSSNYENARKSLFNGGEMIIYYLLVSYNTNEAQNRSSDEKRDQRKLIFSEMKKKLGSNTAFLELSKNKMDVGDKQDNIQIWNDYFDGFSTDLKKNELMKKGNILGNNIDSESVEEIFKTIKQIAIQGLISHMQRQIITLSEQTSTVRKGITGRLFSAGRKYFSGTNSKLSTKSTDDYGEVFYLRGSTEHKLRKLADYLFMLKGYKLAQAVYVVSSREFNSDRSWKCFAGAQEMIGLCKLLDNEKNSRDRSITYLSSALTSYSKSVWLSELYMFRSLIFYYELYREYKDYESAVQALNQVSGVTNYTCSALFLEQAAIMSNLMEHKRKALLYNQMASKQYELAKEFNHSYRLFKSEKKSDFLKKWKKAKAQVDISIGHLATVLNNTEEFIKTRESLINDISLDENTQSNAMRELKQVYNQILNDPNSQEYKDSLFLDLTVPVVRPETLRLLISPNFEGEDCIMEWPNGNKGDGIDSPVNKFNHRKVWCSPGETVSLLVIVENPLKIPISLNNISLIFDIENQIPDGENKNDTLICEKIESIELEPLAQTMLTIPIITPQNGKILIKGLKYMLENIIPGEKTLVSPGKRLNNTLAQRTRKEYSEGFVAQIEISPNLPYLHVTMEAFPNSLFSGQVEKTSLKVKNIGNASIQTLQIWFSHPKFFHIDKSDLKSTEFLESVVDDGIKDNNEEINEKNIMFDESGFYRLEEIGYQKKKKVLNKVVENKIIRQKSYKINLKKPLCPGEEMVIPMWIRGDMVGSHLFEIIVGYLPLGTNPLSFNEMRSFKVEDICDVEPSLRVTAMLKPSSKSPSDRILTLKIENAQQFTMFVLKQLMFVSAMYDLKPLSSIPEKIMPMESLSIHYLVHVFSGIETDKLREVEQYTIRNIENLVNGISKSTSNIGNNKEDNRPEIKMNFVNFQYNPNEHRIINPLKSPFYEYNVNTRSAWRLEKLSQNYQMLDSEQLSRIFGLYNTFSMDFLMFWEISDSEKILCGHQTIAGIKIQDAASVFNGALNLDTTEVSSLILKSNEIRKQKLLADSIKSVIMEDMSFSEVVNRSISVVMKIGEFSGNESLHSCSDSSSDNIHFVCPKVDENGEKIFPLKIPIKCRLTNNMMNREFKYSLKLYSPSEGAIADLQSPSVSDRVTIGSPLFGTTSVAKSISQSSQKSTMTGNNSLVNFSTNLPDQAKWNWIGLCELFWSEKKKLQITKICLMIELMQNNELKGLDGVLDLLSKLSKNSQQSIKIQDPNDPTNLSKNKNENNDEININQDVENSDEDYSPSYMIPQQPIQFDLERSYNQQEQFGDNPDTGFVYDNNNINTLLDENTNLLQIENSTMDEYQPESHSIEYDDEIVNNKRKIDQYQMVDDEYSNSKRFSKEKTQEIEILMENATRIIRQHQKINNENSFKVQEFYDSTNYDSNSIDAIKWTNMEEVTPEVLIKLGELMRDPNIVKEIDTLWRNQKYEEKKIVKEREQIIKTLAITQMKPEQDKLITLKPSKELIYFDKQIIRKFGLIAKQQQKTLCKLGIPLFSITEDKSIINIQKKILAILIEMLPLANTKTTV